MKLTFYANACAVLEQDGFRLLSDPWLTDGVFEGSWCHFPPLKTRPAELAGADAVYISHLHEDHFDHEVLKTFRRDMPIVLFDDQAGNFLTRLVKAMGFNNLIRLKDHESSRLGPFELTMFGPFDKHPFHESEIGNLVDSALLARGDGRSVFNFNDNTPSFGIGRELRERYGRWTVAQINYNAAGPYPSCFDNMSREQKLAAHRRVLDRNLNHMTGLCRIFEPDWLMPFAGAYVVAGKQWRKNEYLGTTTWDEAAAFARATLPGQRTLVMNEGLVFDLDEGRIVNGDYVPVDVAAQSRYIESVLSRRKYPYEAEPLDDEALDRELREMLPAARDNLWRMQQRFDSFPDLNFALRLKDGSFRFSYRSPECRFAAPAEPLPQPYLQASLDPRLLRRIFRRTFHWNSAEGGAHIDFVRTPDVYIPDAHTLLAFFHPPAAAPA